MATSTLPEVTIGGWWDARPPLHSCTGYRRAMRTTSRARSQQDLPPSVIAWRAAHGLIALGFLASRLDTCGGARSAAGAGASSASPSRPWSGRGPWLSLIGGTAHWGHWEIT